jgi:hypothetical protein
MNVGLPGGRSGTTLAEALAAFDDARLWEASDAELHLSFAEPRAMLTVLRRNHLGACLHLRKHDGEWISSGNQDTDGEEELELQDVTVSYPRRFFVDLSSARNAIQDFASGSEAPTCIDWARLGQTDLNFVEACP